MPELSNLEDIVALRRSARPSELLRRAPHRPGGGRQLRGWGIEVHTGIAKTGVVGVLRQGTSDRAIMLRADMDALPMQEENQFEHRSRHDGKMHGCAMTATLPCCWPRPATCSSTAASTARVPVLPAGRGGGAGARAMIQDGLFERCEAVFGMHNWPGMEAGTLGVCAGPMMAAANGFKITVRGKGGHASAPQDCADPCPRCSPSARRSRPS